MQIGIGIGMGFGGAAGAAGGGGGDVTAPTLSSAAVSSDGLTLTLTYSEALDATSAPAVGAFVVGGQAPAPVISAVLVSGSSVALTLDLPIVADAADVTISYTPGAAPIRDVAHNNAAALSSSAVTNNSTVAYLTPVQIFTRATNVTLARWLRGDAVTTSSGKVTQRTDLSGNGRHSVPTGTSPNPARQPTATASDARVNSRAVVTYQGEAEASANRDQTGVTWTRAAPGTTPRFQLRVWCQEGPNLGTNRYPFSDLTLNSFAIVRPSGSGSSDATINMRAGASNANPITPTDGQFKRHALAWTNSLATDYQQWGGSVSAGQNAGNTAGTGPQEGVNQQGTAWAWISVADEVELEASGPGVTPTMLQYSQLDAYFSGYYGAGMLT